MSELSKQQQTEVKKEINKQVEKEVKKRLHKDLLEKSMLFGSEFKNHISTALIAAFGFLIALVWRDLILKLIQENVHTDILQAHPYLAELYTALIVTVIAVIGIALVSKWAKKAS